MNYKKMTLDGQPVIVIKNDNGQTHTGETVTINDKTYTIGNKLPTAFSTATVWATQ
jgi:hypothetical protein